MMSGQPSTPDTYMILAIHKRQSNAGVGGVMALLTYGIFVLWTVYILYIPNEWNNFSRPNLVHAGVALFVGSCLGSCLGYYLVRKFRKKYIYVIPNIFILLAGGLIIPRWQSLAFITVANYAAGIGYGIAIVTLTVHMPEVATKNMRGAVVTVISLIIGTSYFAGSWLVITDSETPGLINGIFGGLTVLYAAMGLAFLWCFTLESPIFLIQSNQENEALAVMRRARLENHDTYEIFRDFDDLKALINDEKDLGATRSDSKLIWNFVQMLMLRLLNGISNSILLIAFQYIFSLGISDQLGLGVIFTPRFVVEMLTMYWVEKVGRRKLLFVSCIGCGLISIVSAIILSTSLFNQHTLLALALCAAAYYAFVGLGLSPVSLTYMGELFPLKKKAAFVTIIFIAENALQILLVVLSSYIVVSVKGFFILIGIAQISGGIYFYKSLPETQGLSLRECLRKVR